MLPHQAMGLAFHRHARLIFGITVQLARCGSIELDAARRADCTLRPARRWVARGFTTISLAKFAWAAHNASSYLNRERIVPVYHVIVHGFFTWNADNPNGYYRTKRGRYAAAPQLAVHWSRRARFPAVCWTRDDQDMLSRTVLEISARREWIVYAIATQSTHLHIVIAWHTSHSPKEVQQTLKQIMSLELGRKYGRGRRWFSRNGVPQRVKNKTHLRHLLYDYLPNQAVIFWRADISGL